MTRRAIARRVITQSSLLATRDAIADGHLTSGRDDLGGRRALLRSQHEDLSQDRLRVIVRLQLPFDPNLLCSRLKSVDVAVTGREPDLAAVLPKDGEHVAGLQAVLRPHVDVDDVPGSDRGLVGARVDDVPRV